MRQVAAALVVIGLASACGKKGDSGPDPASGSARVEPPRAPATIDAAPAGPADAGAPPAVSAGDPRVVEPDRTWPIASGDLELTVGARHFGATVVKPVQAGTWPALLIMAGSGPTDRDWNSPLIPTHNGSGRLLAEALAAHGLIVIRWDKAGSGKNPGPPLAAWTLDSYTEEAQAALAYLRGRADVRADQIFVAGHSEGGVHATRLAAADPAIRGVVFLSAAGRSMADIIVAQLESNFRDGAHLTPASVAENMKPIKKAIADFMAGRPVDPKKASQIPPVQQLIAQITRPDAAALARALLAFDGAREAARLPQRDFFVGGGGKDVQVDPQLDGKRIADALTAAGKQVTFVVAKDADHVLKHEPRSVADVKADALASQNAYNAPGRVLDAELVDALLAWLAKATRDAAPTHP
jgi:pimeloyl-ACP methyl ester carboxylesterase